jgi:hypothetical protein
MKINKKLECALAMFSIIIAAVVYLSTLSREWYESLIYTSMTFTIVGAVLQVHYRVIFYILSKGR